MYVNQVKAGETYAYIKGYNPNNGQSCGATIEAAKPVRIIERVAVPKVRVDSCGRQSVINQTRFKALVVNVDPTHMFAEDLDAAINDGAVCKETLVMASDCLCDWEEEVQRAREHAHRKITSQRFVDYFAALAYMVTSHVVELDEVSRYGCRRKVYSGITLGNLTRCVTSDDHSWKDHFCGRYSREYSVPNAAIYGLAEAYDDFSTLSQVDSRNFSMKLLLDKSIMPEMEEAFNITIPPAPEKYTKSGSIHRSWRAWDRRRTEMYVKLFDRFAELPWEQRVEILQTFVYRYSAAVAHLLGGYYAQTIQDNPFSATIDQSKFRSRQRKRFLMIADHANAELSSSLKEDKL
jgi:hypothetical protein